MSRSQLLWAQGLGLMVAASLIVIGSILPWYDSSTEDVSGFARGAGKGTFTLAIMLFACGGVRVLVPVRSIDAVVTVVAVGCAAAVIALALPAMMEIRSVQNADLLGFLAPPAVGLGLKLTMAGGSLAALSSLVGLGLPFTRERDAVRDA